MENLMIDLPTTEIYKIIITEDPEHPGTTCYGIVNTDTDVVEYYDNLLPRTYQAMHHTQRAYDDMMDDINGVVPSLQVVDNIPPSESPSH